MLSLAQCKEDCCRIFTASAFNKTHRIRQSEVDLLESKHCKIVVSITDRHYLLVEEYNFA